MSHVLVNFGGGPCPPVRGVDHFEELLAFRLEFFGLLDQCGPFLLYRTDFLLVLRLFLLGLAELFVAVFELADHALETSVFFLDGAPRKEALSGVLVPFG